MVVSNAICLWYVLFPDMLRCTLGLPEAATVARGVLWTLHNLEGRRLTAEHIVGHGSTCRLHSL